MQREQEHRRFQRTRNYGPQKLTVSFTMNGSPGASYEARLCDFAEGGLGMDLPRACESGEIVHIEGELRGASYSMHLVATARVVFCRRLENNTHRVGVAFMEVSYRPVPS